MFCVLVTGGREYANQARVDRMLDLLHQKRPIDVLVHGAARGADTLAGRWAASRTVQVLPFPAEWAIYGNRAGPVRNEQMLREAKPRLVVAFPGGRGTAHMVSIATAAGVRVWDLRKE